MFAFSSPTEVSLSGRRLSSGSLPILSLNIGQKRNLKTYNALRWLPSLKRRAARDPRLGKDELLL
jgi:hypothetical protein